MRVEALTAVAVAFLFSVVPSGALAEDKPLPRANASEIAAPSEKSETRSSDAPAVMAQAPADPNAQVLADIKVYPCF